MQGCQGKGIFQREAITELAFTMKNKAKQNIAMLLMYKIVSKYKYFACIDMHTG